VLDNITFGPEVCQFNLITRWTPRFYAHRKQWRREALGYLRRLGLGESDASKYPDELSGGMQQRVAIAQALMNRPRILLMDEAFSALDPATRRETQALMRRLWEETGITVLLVTHNPEEALLLSSRLLVLAKEGSGPSLIALDRKLTRADKAHSHADWLQVLDDASQLRTREALSA